MSKAEQTILLTNLREVYYNLSDLRRGERVPQHVEPERDREVVREAMERLREMAS